MSPASSFNKEGNSMKMKRKFDTEEMHVLVEEISPMGSAFGMNEAGEGVFFNVRLVERMELEMADEVIAHCIENYPDKVEEIPWRCIRISDSLRPDED